MDNPEYARTSPEEKQRNPEEIIHAMVDILGLFARAVGEGKVSREVEQAKNEAALEFVKDLQNQGIHPERYRLYYILTNQEEPAPTPRIEYKFDLPNLFDPHGPGRIEQFIENNFRVKKYTL